jgi:hypothetical protein
MGVLNVQRCKNNYKPPDCYLDTLIKYDEFKIYNNQEEYTENG